MHKSANKCNETIGKWCKNKHGASKIIDTFETYHCIQQACSSTHKASLAMVLSWILQWWRLGVSSSVHLGGAAVGRRPLATVVAGNPRNRFVFLDLLGFYLQIQDNHFISVFLLVSTCVAYCNRIFD
jgi:hypothetical protein